MPRVGFEPENRVVTASYDYPKLWLKNQERARILVGLEQPMYEFVHTLNKPLLVNGVPQMETKDKKDGSTYETYKTKFVTKALCLGDLETLKTRGSDPKRCPMCKFAQEFPDYAKPPARRYAMHVIRYRTKAGSHDLATPFSVETVVWGFTDMVYNKLIDYGTEWGNLLHHDLLLGPCTNESFQKFDISVGADAKWLTSDQYKAITAETFRNNQVPDLMVAIGSNKREDWIRDDIAAVQEAWDEVMKAKASSSGSLDQDLSTLLDKPAAAPAAAPAPAVEEAVDSNGVLLDDPFNVSAPAVDDGLSDELLASLVGASEETEEEQAPATPAAAPAVDNFDDLLSGL